MQVNDLIRSDPPASATNLRESRHPEVQWCPTLLMLLPAAANDAEA
jgi:hypothetical protein